MKKMSNLEDLMLSLTQTTKEIKNRDNHCISIISNKVNFTTHYCLQI